LHFESHTAIINKLTLIFTQTEVKQGICFFVIDLQAEPVVSLWKRIITIFINF